MKRLAIDESLRNDGLKEELLHIRGICMMYCEVRTIGDKAVSRFMVSHGGTEHRDYSSEAVPLPPFRRQGGEEIWLLLILTC
jgi:hypothetical protein